MIEKIENDFLTVAVSANGAELQSIYHKGTGKEYLWQGDPQWWPRKAPVLFPIVGRLRENKYSVGSKTYSLPQHGFARDQSFSLYAKEKDRLQYRLQSNEDKLAFYPYPFRLGITYVVHENKLSVRYEVENRGEERLFFSIGAHPGFVCPLHPQETFRDYYLEFELPETLDRHHLADGLFTGETERVLTQENRLPLSEDLFRKDALVFKNMRSSHLWLKSRASDYCLKLGFEGFPYFGIWTKPGAPFLCLEPWCGLADNEGFRGDFSTKEGINALEAGAHFSRTFSIELQRGV